MEIHYISPKKITIEQVAHVIESGMKIALSDREKKLVVNCRTFLDKKIKTSEEPIYGNTAGFGTLCNVSIDKDS